MKLTIKTERKNQIVDITESIEQKLSENDASVCVATVLHTTCALTTADLDPGTDEDILEALHHIVPDLDYRHPHNPSREHVGSHIMAAIIGPSITLPISNSTFILGTWQRIILIEMDGPRERTIVINEL